MMIVDLDVDGRARPIERNRVSVGKVRIQPAASRWQLLVYLVVPALLVAGWLLVRRRAVTPCRDNRDKRR